MNEIIREGIFFIVGIIVGGIFEWLILKKDGNSINGEKHD